MKRLIIILLISLFFQNISFAQQEIVNELPDPQIKDLSSWAQLRATTNISFASADLRYEKSVAPQLANISKKWSTKAWKGEKVHTQFLIWTSEGIQDVTVESGELFNSKGKKISSENVKVSFLGYVITDGLNKEGSGCGIPKDLPASLVEDVIGIKSELDIESRTTRPVWLSVTVPADTKTGIYKGKVNVKSKGKIIEELTYEIEVIDRILPDSKDWKFHLDLWQNPYSVARIHGTPEWSEKHFSAMKPYMEMLAKAGQKTITASIIHDPWNSQTEDVYQSMIKWTKKKDGSWHYDYRVFDSWVSFMMSLGINKLINCYSMIPWNLKFYYYDEALAKDTHIVAKPGSPEYDEHWKPMLADFAKHLKQKGWFDKTTIAMDERPMEDMQKAIAVIKNADKGFKVSLAGNYHPEIEKDLVDYCIASNQKIDSAALSERHKLGYITTFYTCCAEGYPNTFTFSPPAESVWLGWHAANKGYNGYLRWAYNCWPKNPLQDSRFGSWSAGDTYLIYPGYRTSIRFERLIEGIQDFEKIRLLKQEFSKKKQTDKLEQLKKVLREFEIENLKTAGSGEMINQAKAVLNNL